MRNSVFLALFVGAVAALVRSLRGAPSGAFSAAEGPIEMRPAPPSAPVAAVPTTPITDLVLATEPVEHADDVEHPEDTEPIRPAEPGASVTATPPADPDEARPKAWGGRRAWANPADGACPDGYPVKAKLSSGIFHVPGGLSYERTTPDRCYPDAAAAEADGLRQSKR